MTRPDPLDHAWWLASRASGIVALALMTVSVAIGLTMSGKLPRRRGLGRVLLAVHEHASLVALVAIAVHGITLLGDGWLRPGIAGISVPFAIEYRPVWTGLGIVGGYLAAVLALSFYVRARIGPKLWRKLHALTLGAWALSMLHVAGAGTDAGEAWMRTPMIGAAFGMGVLLAFRLMPTRERRPRPGPFAQVSEPEPVHGRRAQVIAGRPGT